MKIDRQLIQVNFVTWLPAAQRLARGQQFDPSAKIDMFIRLWSPIPIDDNERVTVDKLKPEEQGILWAIQECIRMHPDGNEVLAILGCQVLDVRESQIVNQPKGMTDKEVEGLYGIKSGLPPGIRSDVPSGLVVAK